MKLVRVLKLFKLTNKYKYYLQKYYIFNLLRAFITLIKSKSLKKSKFVLHDLNLDVKNMDDDMLLTQIGYYGHLTEKALKHQNRGERGSARRNKLELLVNETQSRKLEEVKAVDWAKRIIHYFDNNKNIYIQRITDKKDYIKNNELLTLIKTRTTTRFWQAKKIDIEIIYDIISTAMNSALSCNRQSIRFAIVENTVENMVEGDSNNDSMFNKAPITIYIADDTRFFREKYCNALNVGGVCSLIQLAAAAYGLTGSWIYHCESYNQKKLKKQLKFTKFMYIFSSITLGYPLDKQEKPPRLSVKRFIVN